MQNLDLKIYFKKSLRRYFSHFRTSNTTSATQGLKNAKKCNKYFGLKIPLPIQKCRTDWIFKKGQNHWCGVLFIHVHQSLPPNQNAQYSYMHVQYCTYMCTVTLNLVKLCVYIAT
jgi:hypothetical protein